MRTAMKKNLLAYFVGLILCLLPCTSRAVLVVKTEIVSGKIVQIYINGSVKLDNGVVYLPSRQGLNVNMRAGEAVTLRYIVETSGEKKFFEFAPGIGSLKPLPPYVPKAEDRQNK